MVAVSLVDSTPPTIALSWSRPSAAAAWTITYEVSWLNGTVIVPRQARTSTQIRRLQPKTQYSVVITAFPVSNLCPGQSSTVTFMTDQS